MVSQILFGESLTVVSKSGNWAKVRLHHDDYEGWVDGKQFIKTTEDFLKKSDGTEAVSLEIVQSAVSAQHHLPILLGSSLPHFDGMNFRINKEKFVFNGQAVMPGQNGKAIVLEKVINKLLNAPYLWGGRSPFGLDCSGFTQIVFKTLGIKLPRDSHQQSERGQALTFITEARAGDIAFFENKQGAIAHTGVILNDSTIAHAYGQVRIDKIDHYGIYNNERKEYTHKLRMIKRLF